MSTLSQAELTPGLQGTFSKVITEGEAALYAGLVGDSWQQVQTTPAKDGSASGRLPVNHNLLVGWIGGLLNTRIFSAGLRCITMQYEFLSPVYCGDRIETVIELTEFNPAKHLATFKANCYNQDKNQVITGQVVMLITG